MKVVHSRIRRDATAAVSVVGEESERLWLERVEPAKNSFDLIGSHSKLMGVKTIKYSFLSASHGFSKEGISRLGGGVGLTHKLAIGN